MLTLTDNAQVAVDRFIRTAGEPVAGLRISVTGGGCSGFQYGMELATETADNDTVVKCGPVTVLVDAFSAPLLKGATIDFVDGLEASGFKFSNPNATGSCGCGSSFSA